MALAAALTGVAMLAVAVLVAAGSLLLAGWASVLGTLFLPLATGAAILRYRLNRRRRAPTTRLRRASGHRPHGAVCSAAMVGQSRG